MRPEIQAALDADGSLQYLTKDPPSGERDAMIIGYFLGFCAAWKRLNIDFQGQRGGANSNIEAERSN